MPTSSSSGQTARGYRRPFNTQFSVFLDNRVGKLLELVNILDARAINIASLTVADSADHAVVRVVTSDADNARTIFKANNIPFSESEILVVKLGPQRTLADLCRCLVAAELNIHYAYPLLTCLKNSPTIAIHTDDQVLACQLLQRKQFELLGEADLAERSISDDPFE